ncbi:MAG: hypothetical protein ACK4N5_18900, partial [Myxococcales bacterium]
MAALKVRTYLVSAAVLGLVALVLGLRSHGPLFLLVHLTWAACFVLAAWLVRHPHVERRIPGLFVALASLTLGPLGALAGGADPRAITELALVLPLIVVAVAPDAGATHVVMAVGAILWGHAAARMAGGDGDRVLAATLSHAVFSFFALYGAWRYGASLAAHRATDAERIEALERSRAAEAARAEAVVRQR